jgi:hypothetical protein
VKAEFATYAPAAAVTFEILSLSGYRVRAGNNPKFFFLDHLAVTLSVTLDIRNVTKFWPFSAFF